MDFEFAAGDTPQQNSLAEVGFARCANRGRDMMARMMSLKTFDTRSGRQRSRLDTN
jgi:hypothetical protein